VPGLCPNNYTLRRTWTATDQCSNSTSATQVITVHDNTPPVIGCPGNVNVMADPERHTHRFHFPYQRSVTIAPFQGISIFPGWWQLQLQEAEPGRLAVPFHFNVGTTTVTYTATDACGNAANCSFSVVVAPNDPPDITCPANINQTTEPGICSVLSIRDFPIRFRDRSYHLYVGHDRSDYWFRFRPDWNASFNPGILQLPGPQPTLQEVISVRQTVTITDAEKPVFLVTPVPVRNYCVIAIFQANFYPIRLIFHQSGRIYYILTPTDKSSLDLNPSTFHDNCTQPARPDSALEDWL